MKTERNLDVGQVWSNHPQIEGAIIHRAQIEVIGYRPKQGYIVTCVVYKQGEKSHHWRDDYEINLFRMMYPDFVGYFNQLSEG